MAGSSDLAVLALANAPANASRSESSPKLEEAFALKDRLVFVDVMVDPEEHVYPMAIKGGAMKDMILSKTERT